jgi:hypothetical protein
MFHKQQPDHDRPNFLFLAIPIGSEYHIVRLATHEMTELDLLLQIKDSYAQTRGLLRFWFSLWHLDSLKLALVSTWKSAILYDPASTPLEASLCCFPFHCPCTDAHKFRQNGPNSAKVLHQSPTTISEGKGLSYRFPAWRLLRSPKSENPNELYEDLLQKLDDGGEGDREFRRKSIRQLFLRIPQRYAHLDESYEYQLQRLDEGDEVDREFHRRSIRQILLRIPQRYDDLDLSQTSQESFVGIEVVERLLPPVFYLFFFSLLFLILVSLSVWRAVLFAGANAKSLLRVGVPICIAMGYIRLIQRLRLRPV